MEIIDEIEGEVEYLNQEEDYEEDFTAFEPMDFNKYDTALFRTDNFKRLSSAAYALWLILSTRLKPNGRVAIQIKDVPSYAKSFRLDPKTIKKVYDELLNYTFTVGKGKSTRTVHLLTIEVIGEGFEYLRIPYESGMGSFDGAGKKYEYKHYIKWKREELESLLMAFRGSELRTLFIIGVHVDNTGKSFPKRKTIAKLQGLTEGIIGRNLNTLEGAGLITRELVPGKTQFDHNEYHLDPKTGITFC